MSFTANQVGGEYKHVLKKAELPREKINLYYEPLGDNGDSYSQLGIKWTFIGNIQGNNSIKTGNGTDYLGEGKPINIMQPYITVVFWRRIK